MAEFKLGPKARQITGKVALQRLTGALHDSVLLKLDYTAAGLPITGMMLRQVGADIDAGKIEVYIDPDLGPAGLTHTRGSTIFVVFDPYSLTTADDGPYESFFDQPKPLDTSGQALVVHEAVHASFRRRGLRSMGARLAEEAAAFLAEALYFRLKEESITADWVEDNPWFFSQPQNSDPFTENSKARIYKAAEAVVDRFALHERRATLSDYDIAELVKAIRLDPAYAHPPTGPSNDPGTKQRKLTLRERRRKRRAARRHG